MKFEFTMVATVAGFVTANTFKEAAKKVNQLADEYQQKIEQSNLNLDLKLEIDLLHELDD